MKLYKIRGCWMLVKANCLRQAVRKLVASDEEILFYTPHWYTRSNRPAWAEFETTYGYKGIVEEVEVAK